jgi:hypothetical protein
MHAKTQTENTIKSLSDRNSSGKSGFQVLIFLSSSPNPRIKPN